MTNIKKAIFGAAMLALTTSASAGDIYNYERGSGVFGGNSGLSYDSVTASYNEATGDFSWVVDFAGAAADGGWLVVSPGANPKNSSTELGIAYLDAASGDVWVYAYNGQNNAASYSQTPFLAYFEDAYTTVGDVATLAFNATDINAALDTGFAFGERIGIWYHPSANVSVNGDSGGLTSFSASQNGWLDTNWDGDCDNPNNGCITTVPEPGSLPLIMMGGAILALRRRLKKAVR